MQGAFGSALRRGHATKKFGVPRYGPSWVARSTRSECVRGGRDMGRAWYRSYQRLHRRRGQRDGCTAALQDSPASTRRCRACVASLPKPIAPPKSCKLVRAVRAAFDAVSRRERPTRISLPSSHRGKATLETVPIALNRTASPDQTVKQACVD